MNDGSANIIRTYTSTAKGGLNPADRERNAKAGGRKMRKGARNRQRKRRNLLQRQKRDATNKKMEAKALAEPFPHMASSLPNPHSEVRILSLRKVTPILDAEPGSFRELAQKINE